MRLRTIGTLVMLLVSITIARMQDNPASSSGAVMYDAETGSVYTINADGIQPFADVFAAPPWYDSSIPAYNFRISPDHARLLFNYPDESGIQTYYSADVNTGECCVALDPHDPKLDTIYAPSGAFSPDGTQFAASYQNSSAEIPPQIVVFDLATGDVVGRLPAENVLPYDDNDTHLLNIVDWTEEGIGVFASPCCSPIREGYMYRWQATDVLPDSLETSFNLNNDTLGTGERVRIDFNIDFPGGEDEGLYIPKNVVVYETPDVDPQVIYSNPDNVFLKSAYWVADGRGVLVVHEDGEAYVVLRDGTQIPNGECLSDGTCDIFPFTSSVHFVAGTPDGWIIMEDDLMSYVYYRLDGAALTITPVGEYSEQTHVLETPNLAGCCEESFAVLEP